MERRFTPEQVFRMQLIAFLLAVAFGIAWCVRIQGEKEVEGECMAAQRNIHERLRSYQGARGLHPGDPIPWDQVFEGGPKPMCPEGGTYLYRKVIPKPGTLAAPCSHPEHQFRDEAIVDR